MQQCEMVSCLTTSKTKRSLKRPSLKPTRVQFLFPIYQCNGSVKRSNFRLQLKIAGRKNTHHMTGRLQAVPSSPIRWNAWVGRTDPVTVSSPGGTPTVWHWQKRVGTEAVRTRHRWVSSVLEQASSGRPTLAPNLEETFWSWLDPAQLGRRHHHHRRHLQNSGLRRAFDVGLAFRDPGTRFKSSWYLEIRWKILADGLWRETWTRSHKSFLAKSYAGFCYSKFFDLKFPYKIFGIAKSSVNLRWIFL